MKKANFLFYFFLLISISSCGIFKKKTIVKKPNVITENKILSKYEKIIGKKLENLTLYTIVDQWIGVPYKFSGKSKAGVDCSNFSCIILREAFQFPSNYYFPSAKLAEQGEKINLESGQEGDVVFFSMSSGSKISHVGIYLANNKFVHASTSKGVMINSLTEDYYKKRFVGLYRLKK